MVRIVVLERCIVEVEAKVKWTDQARNLSSTISEKLICWFDCPCYFLPLHLKNDLNNFFFPANIWRLRRVVHTTESVSRVKLVSIRATGSEGLVTEKPSLACWIRVTVSWANSWWLHSGSRLRWRGSFLFPQFLFSGSENFVPNTKNLYWFWHLTSRTVF